MNGCFVAALIARTSDRIPLCAFTDAAFQPSSGTAASSGHNSIRQQIQRILERLRPPTGPNGGDASGPQYQSFDNKDVMFFVLVDAGTNLTVISAVNKLLLRNSGDTQATNHLACTLLDQIFSEFTATYTKEQVNQPNVRAYQFIKFDTTLQKIIARVVQQDRKQNNSGTGGSSAGAGRAPGATSGNPQYDSLKQELRDVHVVIRQNLEDLMTRGEKLETMNNYSAHLKDQSSKYYKRTVHMNRVRFLKTYGPPVVVILLLILFVFWYFVW